MKEGVTTTMKRKRGKGLAAPSHGLLPPSPIYMLDMLLFYTHLVVFHPLPCCSTQWLLLKQSATEIVSHQHLEKWRRRRSSGGSLLPLPHWTEGMEDITEPYV
jgi:hypothetical protein